MKLKVKIIAFVISIAAAFSLLAGCGGAGSSSGVTIVTTIFPEYDWVKNITEGTGIETVMLLGSGSDMHSWQPSADDIMKIVSSDLFIYVGGESDEWVDDILDQHPGVNAVSLLSLLGDAVKEEELVEGMQEDEHEHDHDEEHDEHYDHDEGPEYDEHVWMSLRSSAALVSAIAGEIAKAAPDSEGAVRAAAADYNSFRCMITGIWEQRGGGGCGAGHRRSDRRGRGDRS
ncbi:MAG: zinc ABC transporter substrate-binding protein, partial [Clostridia bacterium]|nr:zinc ABC transporter substrate-binding protein [Clostridia bacterium]